MKTKENNSHTAIKSMTHKLNFQVDEEECSVRETRPMSSVQCSKNDCDTWEVKKHYYELDIGS